MAKKLKLTDVQALRLQTVESNLSILLSEIKRQPLQGDALAAMKALESSAQHIDAFRCLLGS